MSQIDITVIWLCSWEFKIVKTYRLRTQSVSQEMETSVSQAMETSVSRAMETSVSGKLRLMSQINCL